MKYFTESEIISYCSEIKKYLPDYRSDTIQTTPSAELRTPRLPDEDRAWYTFGFNYKKSGKTSIDFGYAYIDTKNAKIRKIAGAPGSENFASGNLIGIYRNADINIISVQVNWKYSGN